MGITVFRGARLLLPGVMCLLASAPSFAETQNLSLPQVIETTLNNNGELKSFQEEKGIRDAGVLRAGLLPNPTLELEAATGALTGSGAENSLSLGVAQEFLPAGKRAKRVEVAERELATYRWQLADRKRTLRAEVETAFCDLLLSEQRLLLAERSIDLNRQLLAVAKDRLAAGDIPELEKNLVEVELLRSEAARIELGRAALQGRSRLASLMGLPPGESPAISGEFDARVSPARTLADLKLLALGTRPDLKALQEEKGRGGAEMALARAEAIPNLTAGIALSRDTTAMEIGGVEGKDTAYTVGVKFSMPIPVFDKNRAGLQEASARMASAESRLSAAARNVQREVETAYAGFLNAEQVVSLYRAQILQQLEENLRLTQEAYRLGEVDLLAVIQEQKKFYEISDGYLAALHARRTALVQLESAVAADINGGAQ
ncbi:MAG TPA: TolC family protein [Geobacter sp.]|nr:TolC family protein [Geobacter sp.]